MSALASSDIDNRIRDWALLKRERSPAVALPCPLLAWGPTATLVLMVTKASEADGLRCRLPDSLTMRYLKAAAVGLFTGIVASVLWIGVPIAIQLAQQAGNGSGAVAVGFTFPFSPPFFLGFVLGFWGSLRRSRRKAAL